MSTKTILITGASSGFGKLTTSKLLENGHNVLASMRDPSGRNTANASELEAKGAKIVEIDVTDEKSVSEGVANASDIFGQIDVLINNAGVGVLGIQETFTVEDWKKVFEINVFGVQRMNRAVIPQMRQRGEGLLIHVSSLLGRMTIPFYGPYNATKWALEAMAENYRTELSGFGVDVCIVEPGGYPTDFLDNLIKPSDTERISQYGEFANVPLASLQGFEQALAANPAQTPTDVSDAIAEVIETSARQRPFRTVVDKMGMGDPIKGYNESLDQITRGIYEAFGMSETLDLKVSS